MNTNNGMMSTLRPAITLFAGLTILVGVLYPLAMTGLGKVAFSDQVEGSMIVKEGKVVGSLLIGQSFTSPKYFWGRPSSTGPMPNNGISSSGANLGPTNVAQLDVMKARVAALQAADPDNKTKIPVDLVTASASGLDPEISLAAAYYQIPRIAREHKIGEMQIRALVDQFAKTPVIFGEARVNVLQLNLVLSDIK